MTELCEDGSYMVKGAHFLWIGDRTRDLQGAHVEFFRGITNPIGVKVGPSLPPEELVSLVRVLNPHREPGRLTLITRYGDEKVAAVLPGHVRAVRQSGIPVVWCCDPCHGNTELANGKKTRLLSKMFSELELTFSILRREGAHLGGVHLELTGEDVTECIGGSDGLRAKDLHEAYETYCDPRLNYTQSLDMAFQVASLLTRQQRQPTGPSLSPRSRVAAVSRFAATPPRGPRSRSSSVILPGTPM